MNPNAATDLRKLTIMLENCDIIADIIERTGGDEDAFLEDKVYQASAAFCLQRIGQMAKELSPELTSAYMDHKYWKNIKGTRDIMAHQYHNVQQEFQWNTITDDIPPLRELLVTMIADVKSKE